MIESVVITVKNQPSVVLSTNIQTHKLVIDTLGEGIQSFDIVITFQNLISSFRNHDYTWVKANKDCVAGTYSPKAVQLSNGVFVQPNVNEGIWEIHKKSPNVLLWRFNPMDAMPLATYKGSANEKVIQSAKTKNSFPRQLELLFSQHNAVEFSRSPIPFSAIACFTDHCDFDTLENVQLQRTFFKEHHIKVTKGFFLNHFSKREDNASYENNTAEFNKWRDDGHELAYHSLSQSLKSDKDSFEDFFAFHPPLEAIPTWIDHGFQCYNLSLYQNYNIADEVYSNSLKDKKITTLWNYIDSGVATAGVLNQLNPNDFKLQRYYNGIRHLKLSERIGAMLKCIMFFYYADEKLIDKYKKTAQLFKDLFYGKKIKLLFKLFQNLFSMLLPVARVFLLWNKHKNIPFKLAKYTPLFFKHRIGENDFYIFQTVEMNDFKKGLQPSNIEKLIAESGIFIAHTYFSLPLEYHRGRLLKNESEIDIEVIENFVYLSKKIKEKLIWNPTLNDLITFMANFEKTLLEVNDEGKIIVANASGLPFRNIE